MPSAEQTGYAELKEQHPSYHTLSANEVARQRGRLFAAFERDGLPAPAVPYLLDALINGRQAYLVAGAARGLRGAARPEAATAPYLVEALQQIRFMDDSVSLDDEAPERTTAVAEIIATLGSRGSAAGGVVGALQQLLDDREQPLAANMRRALAAAIERIATSRPAAADACCTLPAFEKPARRAMPWSSVAPIALEDQDGRRVRFGEFFTGRPSVVVFFYTRCDNPNKCSQTIARLGELQELLASRGLDGAVRTAAISYDPGYDLPVRLRAYGANRNLRFGDDHRVFRCDPADFAALRSWFDLGVSYTGSIVNYHRIEGYLLDARGRRVEVFGRLGWSPEAVADRVQQLLVPGTSQRLRGAGRAVLSVVTPLAVAFFPKCPVCWAAYASMFGLGGVGWLPYSPWLWPVLIALMLVNLGAIGWMAWRRGSYAPFALSLAGALCLCLLGLVAGWRPGLYLGLAGLGLGAVWNSVAVPAGRAVATAARGRLRF
jgi:protein SCO1/2